MRRSEWNSCLWSWTTQLGYTLNDLSKFGKSDEFYTAKLTNIWLNSERALIDTQARRGYVFVESLLAPKRPTLVSLAPCCRVFQSAPFMRKLRKLKEQKPFTPFAPGQIHGGRGWMAISPYCVLRGERSLKKNDLPNNFFPLPHPPPVPVRLNKFWLWRSPKFFK